MCGIVAVVSLDRGGVDIERVRRMTSTLAHRGPDGEGLVALGGETCNGAELPPYAVLGHRRLAILDLTEAGHQPMSRDGVTVSFNGEIYNYLELREELQKYGVKFSSESDTEVLLQAYRKWGLDFLEKLNGIFAFVLDDPHAAMCIAVRDRLGVKPLFWTTDGHQVLLASEMRALRVGLPSSGANDGLVYDFLLNGRLDHSEETFFRGIYRVPAAHYLEISGGRTAVRRYWSAKAGTSRFRRSFEDNVTEFNTLLRDSVKIQMRSDVPVGCCLSGGLDSSSVVSLASAMTDTPMTVFTARYREPTIDEWRYATAVHRANSVEPVAVFAEPQSYWDHLSEVVRAQEEPFGGPAVFAQWLLMKEIRANGIKVVLDGQGGDELLCGYAKYFYFHVADQVRSGRWMGAALTSARLLMSGGRQHLNLTGARRYLPVDWWFRRRSTSLLTSGFAEKWRGRSVVHPRGDVVEQQIIDITRYGLPTLLRYEDRNSMAHGVEARVPFLDHRLVEFALSVPVDHKIRGGRGKLLLREALKGVLPEVVRKRRSKLGFGGKWHLWVDALRPNLVSWAERPTLAVDEYVNRGFLKEMIQRRDPAVFNVLVLDRWLGEML